MPPRGNDATQLVASMSLVAFRASLCSGALWYKLRVGVKKIHTGRISTGNLSACLLLHIWNKPTGNLSASLLFACRRLAQRGARGARPVLLSLALFPVLLNLVCNQPGCRQLWLVLSIWVP